MKNDPLRELEPLIGGTPIGAVGLTSPWGSATRTQLVTLADGQRVVLQRSADRRGMGRRLRLGRLLPGRAPHIPWAEVLAGDAAAGEPFLVSRFETGIQGSDLLGNDQGAAALASQMGGLVPALSGLPTGGWRLSTLWGDPERLSVAATRWVRRSETLLGSRASARVRRMIDGAPEQLGAPRPTFAHGDFAPVNVIVRDGAIIALLDLERARVAHPLFDVAWWRLMVRFHHPERWAAAGHAFFSAAALELSARVVAQLDLLAILQCLEMIGGSTRARPAARDSWATRLLAVLEWR